MCWAGMIPRRVVSLEVQLPSEPQESRIWPWVVLVGNGTVPSGVTPGVLLLPIPVAEDGGHFSAPGAAQWCTVPLSTHKTRTLWCQGISQPWGTVSRQASASLAGSNPSLTPSHPSGGRDGAG